jgi:hypothetical protein
VLHVLLEWNYLRNAYLHSVATHINKGGGHTTCRKNLGNVHPWMTEKMQSEYKVCDKCRKRLYQLQFECNNLFLEQEDDSSDETDSGNEMNTYSREIAVPSLNESFQSVGETPVRLKTICETNYTATEVATIESAVRK